MQQWAGFAILGAMFVTAYLLILAWQRLWSCCTGTATTSGGCVAHEVSADLPNAQNATVASDLPQTNVTASQSYRIIIHLQVSN